MYSVNYSVKISSDWRFEAYYSKNGETKGFGTWKIVGKEVHTVYDDTMVFIIGPNGGLTWIARIDEDGRRRDFPKEEQTTWKKVKE